MKTMFATVVMLSLVFLVGCKSDSKPESPPPGPAAPPTQAEINSAKLQAALVPQAVQDSFGRDCPGAAIDKVEMHNTSTGDSFYQITYIRNGQPGVARYFATGAALPAN